MCKKKHYAISYGYLDYSGVECQGVLEFKSRLRAKIAFKGMCKNDFTFCDLDQITVEEFEDINEETGESRIIPVTSSYRIASLDEIKTKEDMMKTNARNYFVSNYFTSRDVPGKEPTPNFVKMKVLKVDPETGNCTFIEDNPEEDQGTPTEE